MALFEIRTGNGGDIPTTPTSSVGEVVYPPVAASEKRKKGLFPSLITLPTDLMNVTAEFGALPFGEDTSRISVRYFVDNAVMRALTPEQRAWITPFLEGMMELDGNSPAFNDCSLVYLGKNSPGRQTAQAVFEAETQMAQEIFAEPMTRREYDYSGFSFREITPEDKLNPDIIDQYASLYRAFGWNRDQVMTILQNPTSILLGTFVDHHLVSAGMAERAEFVIERGGVAHPFVMYEITEAATQYEYRKRGLYTKVASELMKLLAHTDIELLYGESNLLSEAVIRAARSLGRSSSMQTMRKYGFPPRALEQHVRISGGPNDSRPPEEKNDLLPTYITRNKLIQYVNEY